MKTPFQVEYQNNYEKIYQYILKRVGFSREVALDLTQETFVRALGRYGSYEDRGASYAAYLIQVAKNLLSDYYSDKKSNPVYFDDLPSTLEPKVEADFLDRVWMREVLEQIFNELNHYEREVVKLRFVEDLQIKDIAIKLNKSENAIKIALSRLRKKLGKLKLHRL